MREAGGGALALFHVDLYMFAKRKPRAKSVQEQIKAQEVQRLTTYGDNGAMEVWNATAYGG